MKPYEVELWSPRWGPPRGTSCTAHLRRLVVDEPDFVVMGGAHAVTGHLREHFLPGVVPDALSSGSVPCPPSAP